MRRMQQMEISKTFSVKDLDFLRDKKVVSYWQKRDFLTEKKSESIFEGKRGSILVSIVSNNISKKKIKLNIIFDEKDTKMKNYYKSAKKKNVFLIGGIPHSQNPGCIGKIIIRSKHIIFKIPSRYIEILKVKPTSYFESDFLKFIPVHYEKAR